MMVIFIIASLLITISLIYLIGRIDNTHKELIRLYNRSEDLVMIHTFLGLIMFSAILVTICAINNTFWHLNTLL